MNIYKNHVLSNCAICCDAILVFFFFFNNYFSIHTGLIVFYFYFILTPGIELISRILCAI